MGQSFPKCWKEAWPVIGAAHDSALAGDTAFLEAQHIFLERRGYISPLPPHAHRDGRRRRRDPKRG